MDRICHAYVYGERAVAVEVPPICEWYERIGSDRQGCRNRKPKYPNFERLAVGITCGELSRKCMRLMRIPSGMEIPKRSIEGARHSISVSRCIILVKDLRSRSRKHASPTHPVVPDGAAFIHV